MKKKIIKILPLIFFVVLTAQGQMYISQEQQNQHIQKTVQQLKQDLLLTDIQCQQIQDLYQVDDAKIRGQIKQYQTIQNVSVEDKEKMETEIHKMRNEKETKLQKILTVEQYTKYQKIRDERMQR